MKKLRQKGITLIALVITIIIILILAGVSISMLTGNNGILTQAKNAKEQTEKASEMEGIQLAVMSASMKNNGYTEVIDTDSFKQELQNQFGNEKINVDAKGDGSFLVTVNDRKYYINDDKTVISSDNILEINDIKGLKAFRDSVNKGKTYEGWYIYLADDITLDINEKWEPIGNRECKFKGIFDGNKFEINGIYINSSEKDQGLFGYTENGTIKKLEIGQNCNIIGGRYTGGIVGTANKRKIISCYNRTSIQGNSVAGGIAGQITVNSLISECYNMGDIKTSGDYAGGICGSSDKDSTIEKCYNISIIKGNNYIGGIAGALQTGSLLQNCYNRGDITGNTHVGGICGEIYGQGIETCAKNTYNVGSIIGTMTVSGIAPCWENGITVNSFYLENSVNGGNDSVLIEGSSSMSSNGIKQLFNVLGNEFEEDKDNINDGYPILNWQ